MFPASFDYVAARSVEEALRVDPAAFLGAFVKRLD